MDNNEITINAVVKSGKLIPPTIRVIIKKIKTSKKRNILVIIYYLSHMYADCSN